MGGSTVGSYRYEGYRLSEKHGWMQKGKGPAEFTAAQDAVSRLGSALIETDTRLRDAVAALGGEWNSTAGSQAGAQMQRAAQWAGESNTTTSSTQSRVVAQANAVSTVTAGVPAQPPITYSFGDAVQDMFTAPARLFGMSNNLDREVEKQRAADDAANRALYTYESASKSQMAMIQPLPEAPKLTGAATPVNPGNPPGPPILPPGGRPSRPGGGGGGSRTRTPGGSTGSDEGTVMPGEDGDRGSVEVPRQDREERIDTSRLDYNVPAPTPAPGVPPNQLPPGGGTPPAAGGGGGFAGGFGPGGLGAGGFSGGPGAGGPGGAAGSGNQPGGARPAAPTAGVVGRPGTAGSGIMQPATGAAGRGEEDKEHLNDLWVRDDSLFADKRRVSPPVIGEDPV
ncbi:hypothetical protein JOF53_000658 [Crossiella equi]|uniref:PPE family domain-containing protein n=1 Tax=Crossiella equi TaxID=130796 RepID=A0ABS5A660_9PSEU|nr:hypothetical protein [Crossiella equi]MBP2471786.1 hypothetical protein [Crossiella equi]